MLVSLSNFTITETCSKQQAEDTLDKIREECTLIIHEYSNSDNSETKKKCLFQLLEQQKLFQTLEKQIPSAEEYDLVVQLWAIQNCFKKFEDDIEAAGGEDKLLLEGRMAQGRDRRATTHDSGHGEKERKETTASMLEDIFNEMMESDEEDDKGVMLMKSSVVQNFESKNKKPKKLKQAKNGDFKFKKLPERTYRRTTDLADILTREDKLKFLNLAENHLKISSSSSNSNGSLSSRNSSPGSDNDKTSHFKGIKPDPVTSTAHKRHKSRLKKIENLAKTCKFTDNEVKKLRKTDVEAFLIIQKKLTETNQKLKLNQNDAEMEELLEEKKKLKKLKKILWKVNSGLKKFFSRKNPFIVLCKKFKDKIQERRNEKNLQKVISVDENIKNNFVKDENFKTIVMKFD